MLPVPAVSPPPREPVAVASGSDGLRTAAYVAGGLGILGLAGGTYAWSRAKSTYSDLQDRCPNNVCDPSLRSTADEGRSYDRWALIGFVTGGVGLAAGVTMFVLSVDGDAPPDEQGATNLAIGPGSVAVQGRF